LKEVTSLSEDMCVSFLMLKLCPDGSRTEDPSLDMAPRVIVSLRLHSATSSRCLSCGVCGSCFICLCCSCNLQVVFRASIASARCNVRGDMISRVVTCACSGGPEECEGGADTILLQCSRKRLNMTDWYEVLYHVIRSRRPD
jgi:hypothetical protein